MKKFNLFVTGLLMLVIPAAGQTYLTPENGYKTAYFFPEQNSIGAFELSDSSLFLHTGDTIIRVDLDSGEEMMIYGEPAGYEAAHYVSFLTLSPDEGSIWTGYTSDGNVDDRIYCIDLVSGEWKLVARFPGNFDLIFWNDTILVSGLNSTSWSDPNGIFVLDTSGVDQHRKIIDVGGNSAGMAIDSMGHFYYGTSYSMDPNALYRWDSADLATVIETPGITPLQIAGAQKLTDLPAGVYDCEIDNGGNLLFNMNLFGSSKVLGMWNGSHGDGINLDTIAEANGDWDWLGTLKSMGDVKVQEMGNRIITFSFGQALADIHTVDYLPVIKGPIPAIYGYEQAVLEAIDLSEYVDDPDDLNAFEFEISVMSDHTVADLRIEGNSLLGSLESAGQANLVIEATNGGKSISGKTVVGVYPEINGDFLVSDFEDLTLASESYWNGADGSGAYISHSARFQNSYNPDWFSWSGWAYSSVSDNVTPGWFNQYSAITGMGFGDSGNYGVGYPYPVSIIDFADQKSHVVKGFMVTNSTYAALSMEHGDDFAKKFGGAEGSDPDYFKLSVWGLKDSLSTDSIEYYLADYRFEDPEKDYMIKTWQWVDVSSLGEVDSLMFALSSSDTGDWGMNTPGFFCVDNLIVEPSISTQVNEPIPESDPLSVTIYPNPASGDFAILTGSKMGVDLRIFSLTGVKVYEDRNYISGNTIHLSDQPAGSYIVHITDDQSTTSSIILLQ